ncbi:hypothetical protein Ddye_012471 [Dipteronia dyeriana]|uniref:DUF4218 domain-containing protein n=1 Tax=Dipteronia dyeriana TaxID=168575 RepID=A0AAE0CIN9_9ROSI|nr:hypothetical protein Ddye_012471 [Dipteronia dyeriana]
MDGRNVRLGIASDGFNPFGNMSNSYSMWPVFVVPYNLPTWKCMKDPFFMMSLLIPEPTAPGIDIDANLKLRHNLDVMHIEKNVRDSVLGTLMNIDGKTKDTYKTRLDLKQMGIRPELHPICVNGQTKLPPACYSLSSTKKKGLCQFLHSIKLPDGMASNISRCVNIRDCKISELKSHDCHIILQRLLPVALRGYLRRDIRKTINELCVFFKELTSKTLKVDVLERLNTDIVLILCKLEKIFPPSFFDIMIHLPIHLAHEAMLASPTQYRWMYPFER